MQKIITSILVILLASLIVVYYITQKQKLENYDYAKEITMAYNLTKEGKYAEANSVYDSIKTKNMDILNTVKFKKAQLAYSQGDLSTSIKQLKSLATNEMASKGQRAKAIENIHIEYYNNINQNTYDLIFKQNDFFSKFETNPSNKDESLVNMARYATDNLSPSAILVANVCIHDVLNKKITEKEKYEVCVQKIDEEISKISPTAIISGQGNHLSLILVDKAILSIAAYKNKLTDAKNVTDNFNLAFKTTEDNKEYGRLNYAKYNYLIFLNNYPEIKKESEELIKKHTDELVSYLKDNPNSSTKKYIINEFKTNPTRAITFKYSDYLINIAN